jgi:UDP-3-O-[3-hydroxymyristoyl] glucosamine N-acyltransferase
MITVKNIVDFLKEKNCSIFQYTEQQDDRLIVGPWNSESANENQITFFNTKAGDSVYEKISNSNAAIILLDSTLDFEKIIFPSNSIIVKCENARSVITEIGKFFFKDKRKIAISHQTQIDLSVKIGVNCSIAFGVVIDENVTIGENCIIEPNVYIQSNTSIGNNVIIKANTVIGGGGFGYVKSSSGEYEHMQHFGKVIIEDNVHIGSNTCIDRGSLSDTILKKGCRIDNLVHIAHNVIIGENSMIIANSMIAGSVEIGKNCWIAPSSSIKNGISIGENSVVGMSSLVLKSVPADMTVVGVPASVLK